QDVLLANSSKNRTFLNVDFVLCVAQRYSQVHTSDVYSSKKTRIYVRNSMGLENQLVQKFSTHYPTSLPFNSYRQRNTLA
ncbi:MAG: hypothetical protein ACK4UP_10770, partial [Spirosomataceae bacterium]